MFGGDKQFRPWGQFDQVMQSQTGSEWALIGCASFEDRCTTIFSRLREFNISGSHLIFEIEDPISVSTQTIVQKTAQNRDLIVALGFDDQLFDRQHLTEPFHKFERSIRNFLTTIGDQNLIVDITALPKKVYFFLVKLLFHEFTQPRNIVFTYAEPQHYSDLPLAENSDPWEALPGFRTSPRNENGRSIVVGIGYEPLGLPDLVDSGRFDEEKLTFLFPFPAQSDRIARNWRFIRGIFPNADTNRLTIRRVDGINVPEVFDTLSGIGEQGQFGLTLAPFGPKPVSLAMALYAAKTSNSPTPTGVYYTQPKYYNPEYSHGIRSLNGAPVLNTYCVKSNGHFLY